MQPGLQRGAGCPAQHEAPKAENVSVWNRFPNLTKRPTRRGHVSNGRPSHPRLPGRERCSSRCPSHLVATERVRVGRELATICNLSGAEGSSTLCWETLAPAFSRPCWRALPLSVEKGPGSQRSAGPRPVAWLPLKPVVDPVSDTSGLGRPRRWENPKASACRGVYSQIERPGPCLQGTVWECLSGLCVFDLELIAEICIN